MSVDTSINAAATITDADIFDAHIGGKLTVQSTMPLTSKRDLSIAYTPASPRFPAPSRRIRPCTQPTRGPPAWWLSSPTAPRCWASATSAPPPRFPSWKERARSSRNSAASTRSRWS